MKVRVTAAGDAAVDSEAGSRSVHERVKNARANTTDLWGWIFCIVFCFLGVSTFL